jgi:hypothetical protein
MRAAPERPAFYALGGGRAGELLTLLHPPYTAWHVSYFALGAALAPHMYVDRLLWGLAAFALAIGVAGAIWVSAWLVPLVALGGLFLPAYNLEWVGGRLHGDVWFAIGWGGFPAFTGYFVEALKIDLPCALIALACTVLSVAQRRLSSPARELRRRTSSVTGVRELADGSSEELSVARLLAPLDGALAALSLGVVVTACALVAARL